MSDDPNVLIIDDDVAILDSCSQVFVKEGYKIDTAGDGDTGLQKYKEIMPDVVLVDLKMPGKNGMEVLEELKTIDSNCVSIVITGYGTVESAVEAMKRGAYDFLPKPFTPDELRLIVRRGLERRRFIRETESLRREKQIMQNNFITLVSHELRSPLAAVQQNLMVITDGMVGELPGKAQEMLLRMKARIKGLISLIGDWLDLNRVESGELVTQMEIVEIRDVLCEVIELLQPLAEEKKVSLSFAEGAECPPLLGNRETLQMLFTNVIHNGIKYNVEGGTVEIILEKEADGLKIMVEDTGIGIPGENIPLIFEQFYRVKNKKRIIGSGLGLSIAKKIVEAHSGTIEVKSEVGKGTIFTIYLPDPKESPRKDSE